MHNLCEKAPLHISLPVAITIFVQKLSFTVFTVLQLFSNSTSRQFTFQSPVFLYHSMSFPLFIVTLGHGEEQKSQFEKSFFYLTNICTNSKTAEKGKILVNSPFERSTKRAIYFVIENPFTYLFHKWCKNLCIKLSFLTRDISNSYSKQNTNKYYLNVNVWRE